MLTGRGGSSCDRVDHGIGITEANSPSFNDNGDGESDFGDDIETQAIVKRQPKATL